MKQYLTQVLHIVVITVTGTTGAIVLGLLRFGSDVFSLTSPGFAFVSYGFSGALIFAFYHVRGASNAMTAAVVASAAQMLASLAYISMLQAVWFSFGLNIPVVVVAFLFERKLASLRMVRFLFVAGTYGSMFVILTLIVGAMGGGSGIPAETFQKNFVDGLLLGLGLGLGVGGGEALLHSLAHPAAGTPPPHKA